MQVRNILDLDTRKILKKLNLIIPVQQAKLGPPVGPVLGQVKIKVKDFCSLFNEATTKFKPGLPLPVYVFVFKNETFSFFIKSPTLSFLLKNVAVINGNNEVYLSDLYKIFLIKKQDFEHLNNLAIYKSILSQVRVLKMNIIEK